MALGLSFTSLQVRVLVQAHVLTIDIDHLDGYRSHPGTTRVFGFSSVEYRGAGIRAHGVQYMRSYLYQKPCTTLHREENGESTRRQGLFIS